MTFTSPPRPRALPRPAPPKRSSSPTATSSSSDRSGGQAARRLPGADAGLQRLDPGPDPASARGLRDRRQRREPGRHGGHRPLARPASREPLRRNPRDPGADAGWRQLLRPRRFPDPGVYWYHPHIREDYGQEMGLYGNVLVEPADPDYWPPAHREVGSDARRHPARGRQGGALQPHRDDALGDGSLRRRAPGRAARPTSRSPRSAARSSASTSPTPPTPASSRSRSRGRG